VHTGQLLLLQPNTSRWPLHLRTAAAAAAAAARMLCLLQVLMLCVLMLQVANRCCVQAVHAGTCSFTGAACSLQRQACRYARHLLLLLLLLLG
jgi:hypothetical protein